MVSNYARVNLVTFRKSAALHSTAMYRAAKHCTVLISSAQWSTESSCAALYGAELCNTVLSCIALHYIMLSFTVLSWAALHNLGKLLEPVGNIYTACTAMYCNDPHFTELFWDAVQYIVLSCILKHCTYPYIPALFITVPNCTALYK